MHLILAHALQKRAPLLAMENKKRTILKKDSPFYLPKFLTNLKTCMIHQIQASRSLHAHGCTRQNF